MGMVHAYQKGTLKDAPKSVVDAAGSIDEEDAKHFAQTKHKGLPERKTAAGWVDPAKSFLYTTGLTTSAHNLPKFDRWIDNRYQSENGMMGPYLPGQTPKSISTMGTRERLETPMSPGLRWGSEAVDFGKNFLTAEGNSWLTASPASSAFFSPLIYGLRRYAGQPSGDAAVATAVDVAPPAAAGLIARQAYPVSPMTIGKAFRGGVGTGVAMKAVDYGQHAVGLDAPTSLADRMNEPAWRVGARAFTNMVGGGVGGLVSTKNPIGALAGVATGAMKEPGSILDTFEEAGMVAQHHKDLAVDSRIKSLVDPRVPIDSIGDLNSIPTDIRDELLLQRGRLAASGTYDHMKAVPRSQWKDPYKPEYQTFPEGQRPSEKVDSAIVDANLPHSEGLNKVKAEANARLMKPHLGVAGGLLAAGLGAYGLRKLFGRKEEDKKQRTGYSPPTITTPDRWIR